MVFVVEKLDQFQWLRRNWWFGNVGGSVVDYVTYSIMIKFSAEGRDLRLSLPFLCDHENRSRKTLFIHMGTG